MARPLRIEYPGAAFHVISRGNARQALRDRPGHRSPRQDHPPNRERSARHNSRPDPIVRGVGSARCPTWRRLVATAAGQRRAAPTLSSPDTAGWVPHGSAAIGWHHYDGA
jgi:hypothetical protein